MKALVVGQAPSRDTDGRQPFSGRSGANLASLLGVTQRDLARTVDLVNLLPRWPGKAGKGDAFPAAEARAAAAMLAAVAPHDRVVLCGAAVVRAFGLRIDPLERVTRSGRVLLHLPHPSGVNRWWNDEANMAAATTALRAFVRADLHAVG